MPKYVNADALADGFDSLAYDDRNQWERTTWANAFKVCAKMVRDGIAVDVDPVRHGHWSLNPYNREWDVCSVCGFGTKRREHGINSDGNEYTIEYSCRYCPNCGAKMDGGKS